MIDHGVHDCEPWDDCPVAECWDCGEHNREMRCVRDDLKELIKVLYEGGEMRLDAVDRCVEQLCHRTGMLCPKECLEDIYGNRRMRA